MSKYPSLLLKFLLEEINVLWDPNEDALGLEINIVDRLIGKERLIVTT